MAVVNRYTNISIPRYNPRSLQELMLVPAYKREQHDKINEGIAELETGLAQYDGLDVHSNLLQAEQKKLYDKMNQQAQLLEEEGFSPSSKSNFLRFNKEYQQAVGPQGIIGKISEAKKIYEQEKATLLENATKMRYGLDKIKEELDKAYLSYTQKFNDTGKVENFQAPMPPVYEDLQKDILEVGKAMGSETITKLKQNGYKIGTDEQTGLFVIQNSKGEVIESSNDPNIQDAIKYLNSKWLNEGGKGYASAPWQGLTPEAIQNQINEGLGLQRVFKSIDQRETNYQFTQPNGNGKNETPTQFLNDVIQGINSFTINPNSPLLQVNGYQGAKFNPDGSLNEQGGTYKTFEDKLNAFRKQKYNVVYDAKTNSYVADVPAYGNAGTGSRGRRITIYKDWNHRKSELDKLRADNPSLVKLSDLELVERMTSFKERLKSNYVTVNTPIGASYEWTNDRLFGNKEGSGEKGAGVMRQKGATLSGKELTYDQVYKELGYDNYTEFRVDGNPTLQGYVPSLGKWQSTAYDKNGNPQDIFIEAEPELKTITARTQQVTKALLEGKTFENLGEVVTTSNTPKYMYMINDFENPMIVVSDKKVNNAVELNNLDSTTQIPFSQFASLELQALQSNDKYIALSGLDKTNK